MYEEILDVAEQLFMTQGYQATSTRQITQILGVTQPTIYYHFKNKEDIYYQVMLRLSNDVEINLKKIANTSSSALEIKLLEMVEFLKAKHPFNLFVMMHDIQHTVSKETSMKLYQLFLKSYKSPFIQLLQENKNHLQHSVDIDFAVSQLFILMAAYLDSTDRSEDFSKRIYLYLHGIYQSE
ncbi:TetR/AcrR family transcriptional regulator [Enterococcus saccharolyticus]|uniref:TetR/AcrR family transcriptional regulator n=1 Tax=Enterococcus saccharolyticus TaxID=41997 RepID=UPI0039DFFB27